MRWLAGYTLASIVGAFLVVRLFEYIVGGAHGALGNAAKASLFVTTWTTITAGSGMRDLSKCVRQFRQKAMSMGRWLNTSR